MFVACEYRHINIQSDMSRHDVVKRLDFRSAMKCMQNTNPSHEKVLTVFPMDKRPR